MSAEGTFEYQALLFIPERLHRQGAPGPCLALGFGPGVVAEVALLDC